LQKNIIIAVIITVTREQSDNMIKNYDHEIVF